MQPNHFKSSDQVKLFQTKLTTFIITTIITLTGFIITPKALFKQELPYQLATSLALVDDDNLIFYDYKVYSSEERFLIGLSQDVIAKKQVFALQNDVMVVKIPGENKIEIFQDYILIQDENVPELNIEYHVLKNIEFNNTLIPARTFILLAQDVLKFANRIYLITMIVIFSLILIPQLFKVVKLALILKSFNKDV
jgi:hypothetical protein